MRKRTVMAVALGLVACMSWAATSVIADPGDETRALTAADPESTPPAVEAVGPQADATENPASPGEDIHEFRLRAVEGPVQKIGGGGGAPGEPRALCGGSATITLSNDPSIVAGTSVRCAGADGAENAFARCFPASLFSTPNPPFNVTCLDMGLETDLGLGPGTPYDTTVVLSFITDCLETTVEGIGFGDATPVRTITVSLPGDGSLDGTFISVPVDPPLVVDGSQGGLLLEWHNASLAGEDLIVGANALGSTCDPLPGGCSYIWSPPCGLAVYGDVAALGFSSSWRFDLGGDPFNVPVACCTDDSGLCDDSGMILAGDCLGPNQRFLLQLDCNLFNPPCGIGACCNNDGTPDGACTETTLADCSPVPPFPPPPVGSNFRWTGGQLCIDTDCTPPPLNDDCRFAEALTGAHVSAPFNSAGAQTFALPSDPNLACGDIFRDVWFQYTVPALPFGFGSLVISTTGSNYDTYYVVYQNATVPATRCNDISSGVVTELVPLIDTTCRQDDVSVNNPLSYMIFDLSGPGGDLLTIRVGGPGANDRGQGFLNIDLVETPGQDTRCCFTDGTCTDMANFDCDAMGGFWDTETNFYEGILNDPLTPETNEFFGLGCVTQPCPAAGNACWNPLDLEPMLPNQPVVPDVRQEITLTTRQKLYLKWTLSSGETISLDTCGTAEGPNGFDTIVEAFGGIDPFGATSNGDCALPITTSISGGVNNTCDIPDAAYDNLMCRTSTNSCICIHYDDAINAGVVPDANGDVTVIFCIGVPNPGNDPAVNSIDPVLNPLDPAVDVIVGATLRAACILCEVVGDQIGETFMVDGQPVTPIQETEMDCADGQSNRTNDGCSVGGALLTVPIPEPAIGAPPTYMYGTGGVYIDPNEGQRRDQDWYSFTLSQATRVNLRLVQAEYPAQIVLFRAGPLDPCNVGGLALTTGLDCVDVTLTVDCCAGAYFAVIRSAIPNKPICGAEYLACISGEAVPPGAHCTCPADVNNDDTVDGKDIQLFVDTVLNPPVAQPDPIALTLGGCFVQESCAADMNGDGEVNQLDVNPFAAALLAGAPCPAVPPCEATNKCQIPTQQGQGPTGTLCIFDDVSRNLTGAENFTALEDADVTSICWWGPMVTTSSGCAPPLGDGTTVFNIRYYDDAAGLPGALIAEFLGVTPASATVTGNVLVSGIGDLEEIEFTATHAPVPVVAGQCYWVEIQGDSSAACFFCWETAPPGDDMSLQSAGAPFVAGDVNPYDLAFCVDVLIADNGCAGPGDPVGQCCFLGELGPDCVETTSLRCDVIYDGYNFDPAADCTVCCPAPPCEASCQAGDQIEPEGCGFSKNEGCNGPDPLNPQFAVVIGNNGVPGQIACQDPPLPPVNICGTIPGNVSDFNDDWYEFNVLQPGFLTMTFETSNDNFAFLVTINPADCTVTTLASVGSGDCTPGTDTVFFTGGLVYVVVQGSQNNSPACGSAEASYRVSLACAAEPVCPVPLTCPPGGIAETELCGGDSNGGCNDPLCNPGPCGPPPPPTVFEPLPLACPGTVTVCGTSQTTGTTRDTDWWGPVTLTGDTDVTVTLTSDFTAVTFALEVSDCAAIAFSDGQAVSSGCTPASFTECLPAGSWVFFVAPSNPDGSGRFDGSPCASPSDPFYVLEVTCGGTCVPGSTGVVCGPEPLGCQSPSLTFGNVSDQDQGTTIIDDFTPAASGNVSAICWWGFEDDLLLPGPQDCTGVAPDIFEITYYADAGSGNVPDLGTIVGGPFTPVVTRFVEQTTTGSTIYRYEASHAAVPVTAGVCTWVEIKQTNGECFCTWVWMSSDQASGNGRLVDNTGGVLTPFFDDASFCVDLAVDPTLAACPVLGACCIVPVDVPVCVATESEADCLARPDSPSWHRFEDCATFQCPFPLADFCADALDVSSFINTLPILGDNTTATPPGNDPELPTGSPSCQWQGIPTNAHNTVWVKLVAPANGSLTIETCALGGAPNIEDTIIALYSTADGTCGTLAEVSCGEDECTGAAPWLSRITTTTLIAGNTYYLMLANTGGYAGSIPGPFQIDITSP